MKHICETMKDYIDAMNTSMQGDVIFCSEKLWNEIHNVKSQPERLSPEDSNIYSEFGCSIPVNFITSKGIKTLEPGKRYNENLDEIE